MKRCRYHFLSLTIALSGKLDDSYFDFKDLKKFFPDLDPKCFSNDLNLKMRDDLPLKFFSKKNILLLMLSSGNPKILKVLIYFVLVYPLEMLFIKVNDLAF